MSHPMFWRATLAGLVLLPLIPPEPAASISPEASGRQPPPFGDAFPGTPACATPPPGRALAPDRGDRPDADSVVPKLRTSRDALRHEPSDDDLYEVEWTGLRAAPVTADIPFLVRSEVAGITIRAEAPGSGLLVSVELVDPDGQLIACHDCEGAAAVAEMRIDRGTLQMPSTDRDGWELSPGEYAFRVRVMEPPPEPVRGGRATGERTGGSAGEDTVVDVLATFRTGAGVTVEHRLDLNFVYLPGCALSADIASSDTVFAAMMDTVRSYMAPTGIKIGEITHVDLDRPEFSVIATWEEAGDMFRTTAETGRPRALNVYCVQAFEDPLNPVVGLSGGIPGARRNGTPDSGIAVRTSPLFLCWEFCLPAFGSLFAHEIGHYLGLYHTTEATRETWDPFSDTPECRLPTELNACPDFDYVMYPLIHPVNTIWSPGQISTVTTHPLVQVIPVAGAAETDRCALAFAPNPFRGSVRIEWPHESDVSRAAPVRVHDVTGRLVRALLPDTNEHFGRPSATWDGRDDGGRRVPPGMYFARWPLGNGVCTGRLVRLP